MKASERRAKFVFVNRFFYPDHSATAQILSDLAVHLAGEGRQVEVICSRLSYTDPELRFEPSETWQGIAIHRVATTGFGRHNLVGRLIDYLSFYMTCFFSVLHHVRKGDVVVVKTDPPLLSVPMGFAGRLKGARVVNWLQDLFPEVGAELGIAAAKGPIGAFLRGLRNRSLKKAVQNVAIGERMAERLLDQGVPDERVTVIPNFSDDLDVRPDPEGWRDIRTAWDYSDSDFVVGYSGNLGRAHDVNTLLGAAELLREQTHIKFLFVGGGHLKATVEDSALERGLKTVTFKPYQPREKLAQSLSVPDLHWVSLQPALEGLIVPSKLYGIAAVGRPLLMIGDLDGEIGRLASAHRFGVSVEIGDCQGLADLLLNLSSDPEKLQDMGRAARAYIDRYASRAKAFQAWSDLLESTA